MTEHEIELQRARRAGYMEAWSNSMRLKGMSHDEAGDLVKSLYPITTTRPREIRTGDGTYFRVSGSGDLEYRAHDRWAFYANPERLRVWADLLNNPNEEVSE